MREAQMKRRVESKRVSFHDRRLDPCHASLTIAVRSRFRKSLCCRHAVFHGRGILFEILRRNVPDTYCSW